MLIEIRRALLSVSDKTGLVEFAAALSRRDIEILSTGGTARLLREHGKVDLLLTDVIMPGRNGRELAREAQRHQPGLPVLFMSGYSESVFAGGEPVEHLLQKPFTSRTLLETLDALFAG